MGARYGCPIWVLAPPFALCPNPDPSDLEVDSVALAFLLLHFLRLAHHGVEPPHHERGVGAHALLELVELPRLRLPLRALQREHGLQ